MKATVLFNSRSGTALSVEDIAETLHTYGLEGCILELDGLQESRLLEAACHCDLFVAAGGDGTVNTTAQALYRSGSQAVLGLLPMGTGNDLARTLEIPGDLDTGVQVLARGRTRPLDAVRLDEDRIMVNQANGGFSGEVARAMDEETKGRWGPLAYLRASIDVLTDMPEYDVTLDLDGECLNARVVNLSVANARYSAAGVPVAPHADVTDGELDVVLFQAGMKRAILPLAPRILMGTHIDAEEVIYRRGKVLRLTSEPAMPFSVDGELNEEHPRRFEILPGQLRVRVPA